MEQDYAYDEHLSGSTITSDQKEVIVYAIHGQQPQLFVAIHTDQLPIHMPSTTPRFDVRRVEMTRPNYGYDPLFYLAFVPKNITYDNPFEVLKFGWSDIAIEQVTAKKVHQYQIHPSLSERLWQLINDIREVERVLCSVEAFT